MGWNNCMLLTAEPNQMPCSQWGKDKLATMSKLHCCRALSSLLVRIVFLMRTPVIDLPSTSGIILTLPPKSWTISLPSTVDLPRGHLAIRTLWNWGVKINQFHSSGSVKTKSHRYLLSKRVLRVDKPFCQFICDISVDFYVIFLRVSVLCTVSCSKGVEESCC